MKKIRKWLSYWLVIMIALVSWVYFENNTLKVTYYEVASNKVPTAFDGFKIIQLTDLQGKQYGNGSRSLVKKIKDENPDIIVFTGDMLDSSSKNGDVIVDLVESLINDYPIYYISGNHEQIIHLNENNKWIDLYESKLREIGVIFVDNDTTYIEKEGRKIKLSGVKLDLLYYSSDTVLEEHDYDFTAEMIDEKIGQSEYEYFNIMLAHTPRYFSSYSMWGADLILAGHMHGGMIRIPGVGGVFSPSNEYFPEFDYGVYQDDSGSTMIVSGGLGNSPKGFRLLNRPEIVSISLKVV